MNFCIKISRYFLLTVIMSLSGAQSFAKGLESTKSSPLDTAAIKKPAISSLAPLKTDSRVLSSELNRLLKVGEANFVLATSSDTKMINDAIRCPNCIKILSEFKAAVTKGSMPKEALAIAAIDPSNPILLGVVNQVDPQLGGDLIQIPSAAKPGFSGDNLSGSFSMGVQVGVDSQTGLPKLTGVQTGQGNSSRDSLRAGVGLEYLGLSGASSSSPETESGGSSYVGVRNPFVHSDESGGKVDEGQQITTSVNSDGQVTEQTSVTNTPNDTEVVVTTGLYGSSVAIQPRDSSSVLQTWGNALRDFLFGERNPAVQHDEDPNAVSAPSAAELGITAPQTLLDAANLRFSGQIDRGDASTAATGNSTANSGVQTVESPDQRPRPSAVGLALPQSTTQAGQLRLGNVTQPSDNAGNSPAGGSFNLSNVDFCSPSAVSGVAADGTLPCH